MNSEAHLKRWDGLATCARLAYLYVRQSYVAPGVREHREPPKRQYGLKGTGSALGLARRAGRRHRQRPRPVRGSDSDREGFQRLVAAVGLGEVGVGARPGGLPLGPQLVGLAPVALDLAP